MSLMLPSRENLPPLESCTWGDEMVHTWDANGDAIAG